MIRSAALVLASFETFDSAYKTRQTLKDSAEQWGFCPECDSAVFTKDKALGLMVAVFDNTAAAHGAYHALHTLDQQVTSIKLNDNIVIAFDEGGTIQLYRRMVTPLHQSLAFGLLAGGIIGPLLFIQIEAINAILRANVSKNIISPMAYQHPTPTSRGGSVSNMPLPAGLTRHELERLGHELAANRSVVMLLAALDQRDTAVQAMQHHGGKTQATALPQQTLDQSLTTAARIVAGCNPVPSMDDDNDG